MGEPLHGRGDFDAFFQNGVPQARAVARRLLGRSSDADDAVAEAFARAWASWWRVGRLDHREAWVLRVTANVAVDMVRKRRPVPELLQRSHLDDDDDLATRVALAVALGKLARRQREVLSLRYVAGLSVEEVAAALRVSVNTVKTHATRGMAALRVTLGDDVEDFDVGRA